MDAAEEARASWVRSSLGWIAGIERGDLNRTCVLDGPMLRLAGNIAGRQALDVGCGEGRFCRMLSERGAIPIGLDPTPPLVQRARALHPNGKYIEGWAEDLPFGDSSFDLVVSYLTLIDIADYRKAISEMSRVLRPGGKLIVANLQSFMTTRPNAWWRDESGNKSHVAVDDYFGERAHRAEWGAISILNWHRPLELYMNAFLQAGLRLVQFEEPRPSGRAVAENPSLDDENRVPWFYVMAWER